MQVGRGNPKSVWWNNEVKAAVKRKEAAWKEALGARDEEAKERCLEVYKEEKRKVKRCVCQSKEVHEQFGRKINQGNKLEIVFERGKESGGRMEN